MYTKDLTVLAMECHKQGFFVVGLLSQHNASLGYHNNEIWDHCKANLKNIKIIYQLTSNIAPFFDNSTNQHAPLHPHQIFHF